MLTNTRQTYGLIAQILHWITAVLILTLIPLGVFMHELPIATEAEVVYKSWFYSLHKTLGVTVFFVAVVRVLWAISQPRPYGLNEERKLEHLAAQTVHWVLYGSIIAMPLTGWLHHSATQGFAPIWWTLPQDLPLVPKNEALAMFFQSAHFLCGLLLGASLLLHILGAFKHALIDKDATLARMMPGSNPAVVVGDTETDQNKLPAILAVLAFLAVGATAFMINTANTSTSSVGTTLGTTMDTTPATTLAKQPASRSGSQWLVDHQKSALRIEIVQSGAKVSGIFENWNASIDLDPENLKSAKIEVDVDVASLSLGSVADQAKGPDFLNISQYPKGRFVSHNITNSGDGAYQAEGELTLVGQTRPLKLHFTLKIENDRAFAEAETIIKRLDFGLGEKGFLNDSQVGFEVRVEAVLEATRSASP